VLALKQPLPILWLCQRSLDVTNLSLQGSQGKMLKNLAPSDLSSQDSSLGRIAGVHGRPIHDMLRWSLLAGFLYRKLESVQ